MPSVCRPKIAEQFPTMCGFEAYKVWSLVTQACGYACKIVWRSVYTIRTATDVWYTVWPVERVVTLWSCGRRYMHASLGLQNLMKMSYTIFFGF